MSNTLAIATVTATLRRTLHAAVATDVPGATVSTQRPDAPAGTLTPRVNLYLYQVTPNAAWRNADLPARCLDGSFAQRPQAALDLQYLLTFYGDEGQLEPQRLLGSVARTLHSQPVLTRQMIRDTVADPAFNFLAGSNLADGVELVKFTPSALSLEELSKLWSVFFQLQYNLSVAYQGAVVLIESEDTPQPALPVRDRNLYVIPFRQPVIEQVAAAAGANQPIVANSTLIISGQRLLGEITRVRVAGVEVTPVEMSDTQISVPLPSLPAGTLRAGVQGVQVVHPILIGTPPAPHPGVESNVAALVLRPTITAISVANVTGSGDAPRSAEVTMQVNPAIRQRQRVTLLLNEDSNAAPDAYTFFAAPLIADAGALTIPISGVKAAEYFVRLQVDGAESPVDIDSTSPTFGPKITIP